DDAVAVVVETVAEFGSRSGAGAGAAAKASIGGADGLAEFFADSEFTVGAGVAFADERCVAICAGFADVGSVIAGPASGGAFADVGVEDVALGVVVLRAKTGDLGVDDAC